MTWRRRTLIIIAAIALVVFGTPLYVRWGLERRLERAFKANVAIGSSSLRLSNSSISLKNVDIVDDSGDHLHIGLLDATLSPRDLLQRNLVITQVRADECTLALLDSKSLTGRPMPSKLATDTSMLEQGFDVDDFVREVKVATQNELTKSETRFQASKREVEAKFQKTQGKLDDLTKATPNPLRDQLAVESINKDFALIKQALAETRLQVRESNKAVLAQRDITASQWKDQLKASVVSRLPSAESLTSELAKIEFNSTLQLVEPMIATTVQWISSPVTMATESLSRDVEIPGVAVNQTALKSAVLRGNARSTTKSSMDIPFACWIGDWNSNKHNSVPTTLKWQFGNASTGSVWISETNFDAKSNVVLASWKHTIPPSSAGSASIQFEISPNEWSCALQCDERLGFAPEEIHSTPFAALALRSLGQSLTDSKRPMKLSIKKSGGEVVMDSATQEVVIPAMQKMIASYSQSRSTELASSIQGTIDHHVKQSEADSQKLTEAGLEQLRQWEDRLAAMKNRIEASDEFKDRIARR